MTKFVFSMSGMLIAFAVFAALADEVRAERPLVSLRGHGTATRIVGAPEDSAQFIDQISIHADKFVDGRVSGSATWTSVFHDVPADPDAPFPPGQGTSGYPWQIELDRFVVLGPVEVYVEGVVVESLQVPDDVGTVVGFYVQDQHASVKLDRIAISFPGPGGNQDPALLAPGDPLEGGEFSLRMFD